MLFIKLNNKKVVFTTFKTYTLKKITQVAKDKYVFDALFSPNSEKIIYSALNNFNETIPTLYIYDTISQEETNLGIHSFISKVAWSGNNELIIAIPEYIPDDYLSYEQYSAKDNLYKVNLNGEKLVQYQDDNFSTFNNILDIMVIDDHTSYFLSEDKLFKVTKK